MCELAKNLRSSTTSSSELSTYFEASNTFLHQGIKIELSYKLQMNHHLAVPVDWFSATGSNIIALPIHLFNSQTKFTGHSLFYTNCGHHQVTC